MTNIHSEQVLTPRQRDFAHEYMTTANITESYRKIYKCNYSNSTCLSRGNEVLKAPVVVEYLKAIRAEAIKQSGIEAYEVIRQWKDIATADASTLAQIHTYNCRYCYGVEGEYQWTEREFRKANEKYDKLSLKMKAANDPPEADGGFGFKLNRPPNEECEECHGLGEQRVYMPDTRTLSAKEKLLYAGCKQGKNGIEMQLRSQDAALVNIAKHLGMFEERSRDDDKPDVSIVLNATVTDPVEASKIYQQIMTGT